MPVIKTEKLSYVYGSGTPFKKDAITDINIEIEHGELIGIMGHTGSGKSTLIQHFNGLIKPTSGKVFVDGIDIWEKTKVVKGICFKVGIVFQYPEYQLFDETCFKDISFGPKNMGLSEREIKERVLKAANMLEISDEILKKSPFELSGGEKRRVAIAGVLAMQPKVLVLDEPTAGLDPKGAKNVMNLISNYRDKTGSTVIFVSHNMENIAASADRVLVMNKGNAHMFDSVENVFSRVDELAEIGLNIPQVTQIFLELSKKGYKSRKNVFTVQDGKQEILRLLRKGGE